MTASVRWRNLSVRYRTPWQVIIPCYFINRCRTVYTFRAGRYVDTFRPMPCLHKANSVVFDYQSACVVKKKVSAIQLEFLCINHQFVSFFYMRSILRLDVPFTVGNNSGISEKIWYIFSLAWFQKQSESESSWWSWGSMIPLYTVRNSALQNIRTPKVLL